MYGGLEGELSVSGLISKNKVLSSINAKIVPGVDCKFEVSFHVSLTGKASFIFGFDLMGGFAFQHDANGFSFEKLYKTAEPIAKTEFSGTLYLALQFTPVVE